MANLTWDQVPEEIESITPEEIAKAESGNVKPIGKYLVVVKGSEPKQINPKTKPGEAPKDSYMIANLKLEIEEVVEIDHKPVNGNEYDQLCGKIIWDGVNLPRSGENEIFKSRRIHILHAAGIISKTSTAIPQKAFSELIVGKRFLIDYDDNVNKETGKVFRQVSLFGYHPPEEAVKVSESDIADI